LANITSSHLSPPCPDWVANSKLPNVTIMNKIVLIKLQDIKENLFLTFL